MTLEIIVVRMLAIREVLAQIFHNTLALPAALRRVLLNLLLHLLLLLFNLHIHELLDEDLLLLIALLVLVLKDLLLHLLHFLVRDLLREVKLNIVPCDVILLILRGSLKPLLFLLIRWLTTNVFLANLYALGTTRQ